MNVANQARRQALNVLQRVLNNGESLSTALPAAEKNLSEQDGAFMRLLVYGVIRWYWRLDALLQQLMNKPLKHKDNDVRLVLLMALYQLMDTRVPDYASVDVAVKLVKKKKPWAAGLVNGVLRHFIRHRDALVSELETDTQVFYSHPQWIIERLRTDWPQDWRFILEANNRQAPLVLRINRLHISVAEYLSKLQQAAQPVASGIRLQQACDVTRLPGYRQGWFSVQDAGAQRAAPLLDLRPGLRVLDACAAPGGKTGHLLECQPDIELLAMDIAESRLARVCENLDRLGLSAKLLCGDVARPQDWWDGKPFDRILLDVPCSASGVVRRHPDIKLLRRDDDIGRLAADQQQMLAQAWNLLAAGGLLLYATCSVFKQENEQQIEAFFHSHADAQEIPIRADWGEQRPHGRQILPGSDDMDGFYYALIRKTP
jgi:16S rRNA (cytosine967-C5)-methyltransferase